MCLFWLVIFPASLFFILAIYSKFKVTAIIILSLLIVISGCSESKKVSPDKGYYTCSMHPQVIQQEPGDCPICFMKLTFIPVNKKKKDKKSDKKDQNKKVNEEIFTFSIAKELIHNARVSTVAAKKEVFTKTGSFSGHVDYNEDPDRLVIVNTKYDGWIEKLYVSKEGQWVNRGATLMGVYSQKILAAKEEYLTTYKSIKDLYLSKDSDKDFTKDSILVASRSKLLNLDVTWGQIKKIENDQKVNRLTYYSSPISGVVVKKTVLQGSYIKSGQELFRIADLRKLWVFIHIFEKDIPFVKKGQKVNIKTSSYPGKVFKGRIDLLYPYFNMKTRDIKVRIIVPNPGMKLKPGMYINVDVSTSLGGKVVTIPDMSVIYSGDRNYVFVSLGDGEFELRPVTVITSSVGKAVISKGLKENELVVSNGQFLIDSEASLKEAMQKGKMSGHKH